MNPNIPQLFAQNESLLGFISFECRAESEAKLPPGS